MESILGVYEYRNINGSVLLEKIVFLYVKMNITILLARIKNVKQISDFRIGLGLLQYSTSVNSETD